MTLNPEAKNLFSCSDCSKKSDSKVKIMSWNINRGITLHWDQIVALIQKENPDLIFLLETDKDEESLKSMEVMGYKTVIGSAGKYDGKVRMLPLVSKLFGLPLQIPST